MHYVRLPHLVHVGYRRVAKGVQEKTSERNMTVGKEGGEKCQVVEGTMLVSCGNIFAEGMRD